MGFSPKIKGAPLPASESGRGITYLACEPIEIRQKNVFSIQMHKSVNVRAQEASRDPGRGVYLFGIFDFPFVLAVVLKCAFPYTSAAKICQLYLLKLSRLSVKGMNSLC